MAMQIRKDIFEKAGNKVQEILFARPINEVCYGEQMTIASCLMQRPSGELFVSVTTFNSKCCGGVIHDSKDVKALYFLHRHIGGLEIIDAQGDTHLFLHRHIGGLEKTLKAKKPIKNLHRHIGGLESD